MEKAPAIGIDLGTTYSCVAVYRNGKLEIIPNEQGQRTTPSYVSFADSGILVGEEAKMEMHLNPTNTIYDTKRLIGRSIEDPQIQEDLKHWPFKVISQDSRVQFEINLKGKKQSFYPEQISSFILGKLKKMAEEYLGMNVTDAVITVPAYFSNSQRQATKDAGIIAGLNVLRIINEPTAASVAYGLSKKHKNANILIYDLGGGTFDVTIFNVDDEIFEVKSTSGNTHLGGQDFTNSLVKYCTKQIDKMNPKEKVEINETDHVNIRNACEEVKKLLSSSKKTNINIFVKGKSYSIPITQSYFEEMNSECFKKSLIYVEQALFEAKMSKTDIDEIVLVGGSTRIPAVRECLKKYFKGKNLNMTLNPDECVAMGAAVQAAIISGDESAELKNVVLLDVIPLTLGIAIQGEIVAPLIQKNTSIPTSVSKSFTTTVANQESVNVVVYEGERLLCRDNKKLDQFSLKKLPPGPKGSLDIRVKFSIDVNGILEVVAHEKQSGQKNSCIVTALNRLSEGEIQEMIADGKLYEKDDKERKQITLAKNRLEEFCFQILSDIKYNQMVCSDDVKRIIEDEVKKVLEWINKLPEETFEEYNSKLIQLSDFVNSNNIRN